VTRAERGHRARRRLPRRAVLGLVLVGVWWWWGWQPSRPDLAAHVSFFGLWLGYILAVDALCELRHGTSPWQRGWRAWLWPFATSIPAWWLFEYFNHFLHNWEYVGRYATTGLAFAVFATLSFTTVVPAILTTAELIGPARGSPWTCRGPALPASPRALAAWIAIGCVLLAGVVAAPRHFFPAVWLGVLLLIDPIDHALGWPSLTASLSRRDWRPVAQLGLAALVCGLCWELWNSRADPKWIYHVPLDAYGLDDTFVARKLFEMPLLGYLGYLPFGLEIAALHVFLSGLAARSVALPFARTTVPDPR
jgi:hypothetical protein